jgi:putative membrane-bound dehydrogenase-like protein
MNFIARSLFNSQTLFAVVMAVVCSVGGRCGADFPEIYNSEDDKLAVPMAPDAAAQGTIVPDGFKVTAFVSEPDVQNPIASAWDSRGRLWIAENYTYAEREQRFDLGLRDRILIFEDTDGDGKSDKRTVFSDDVQMLTSIEVGHDGVWLMCPPLVFFVPDRNHDDKPDGPAEVVLEGFEVAKENYHNYANGLRFGPDGWLYGRCGGSCPGRIKVTGSLDSSVVPIEGGIWRYHPNHKIFEVLSHGTTNPWGHDWNAQGEAFFINTVNGHLWHLIPGAHFVRPFTLDPNTKVYELIDMHADHWHFDTGKQWHEQRDGIANDHGGGHAHSGMMIYLGDNWPQKYHNDLFTINFHGRRINHEHLKQSGSGYVASHEKDICLSPDKFFRGIDLSYGPDGAVYMLDWSDTGECHENTGVHRNSGRIYRISYEANTANEPVPSIQRMSADELIALHKHKNEWFVRQGRLSLLSLTRSGALKPQQTEQLKQWAIDPQNEVLACRASLTLHALEAAAPEFWLAQLKNPNEHLRALAIRALTDRWPIDDVFSQRPTEPANESEYQKEVDSYLPAFIALAKSEPSGLVRLNLASTVQRLPVQSRIPLALALAMHPEDANDHNIPLLLWYGMIPVAETLPKELADLAINSKIPKLQQFISRRLAELIDTQGVGVNQLVASLKDQPNNAQENILAGIRDGLKGWVSAPKPKSWNDYVSANSKTDNATLTNSMRDLSVLFGDGLAVDAIKKMIQDETAEIGVRQSALESLVRSKAEGMKDICLAVLSDARLNTIAAQGLANFDDPAIAEKLVDNYYRFRSPQRSTIIAVLSSRKSFANVLVDSLIKKRIPLEDVSAFDARQLNSLGDEAISKKLADVWGEIHDSSADKQKRIEDLKSKLNLDALSSANKSNGRVLFQKNCSKCHRMYGEGEKIGPDLTGADRGNLDYLLLNIVDPSAVVSKDYRMSIILTNDDRVLNGLVVSKNEKTLSLQTQTELQSIPLDNVEEIKQTTLSPMPDGILDILSEKDVVDLIGYLKYPTQVALP